MHRGHQVMPHHKVATSGELSQALIGCLLTMSDADKQLLIDTLGRMISKVDNG